MIQIVKWDKCHMNSEYWMPLFVGGPIRAWYGDMPRSIIPALPKRKVRAKRAGKH